MGKKPKWGKENGDVKEEAKWIYLAGILDADGYVGIIKYIDAGRKSAHYKPKLDIIGSIKLMEWLNNHIERRSIQVKHEPFVMMWRVFKKETISKILKRCIPYMTTKKERAILVKKLCDLPLNKHSKEKKEEIYRSFRKIMDEWHAAFNSLPFSPQKSGRPVARSGRRG